MRITIMNNIRRSIKIFLDLILVALAYYAAFNIRLDGDIVEPYKSTMKETFFYVLMIYFVVFLVVGLYRGVWRYSSIRDLGLIMLSNTISAVICLLVFHEFGISSVPRSVIVIFWLLVLISVGGVRFAYRTFTLYLPMLVHNRKHVLVIGAGNAGEMLVRQALKEPTLGYKPVALIDDNVKLQGSQIHGIRVIGKVSDIPKIIKKHHIDEIIIAAPSANATQMRRIVNFCEQGNVPFKTLPGPKEIINGDVIISKIREVKIEDLLERSPVEADSNSLKKYFENKVILVTGAAGSIGSELCRQLSNFPISRLIALDRAESDLFDLEHELYSICSKRKDCLKCIIADITHTFELEKVFAFYKPHIVFHAAAYKHVPFMEYFPEQAVKNNVFGTINVSTIAEKYGVDRFIMISTDKAVNPSSIMGATKRLSELYCVSKNGHTTLKHIVVRFGNVLASKGSVIPLFQQQIRNGGPITVTSKKINRFFMTIPEAVGLVLMAGTSGIGGEIFILDMGDPVNIYTMAKHLVSLSGLVLDKDVKIEITGLRPGEKLYEELWNKEENPVATDMPKVLKSTQVSQNGNIKADKLNLLKQFADAGDRNKIVKLLQEMVPTAQFEKSIIHESIKQYAG